MKNNFRTHNFTNVSDEKFMAMKETIFGQAKSVFNLAIKMGLPIEDPKKELPELLALTEILFDGFTAKIKIMNETMNRLADYANDNSIAVCPEMIFKIQTFIDGICSMDFIDAFYKLKISNPMVTLEDLCKAYSISIDKAVTELSSATEDDNKYQAVMDLIESDRPIEEIVEAFKGTLNSTSTNEICSLINQISKIQKLKVLIPPNPSSEFIKIDSIMSKILILCKDELDRRRASN